MSEVDKSTDWASEYKSFLEANEIQPPPEASDALFQYIYNDLNPKFSMILSKLSLLHAVVGSMSLLLCSQFGMGKGGALLHVFMKLGDLACMAACGSLFLGLTTLTAGLILTRSELRRIRQTGYSPVLLLSLASLLIFLTLGAEIALAYAVAWLVGAIFAGIACTEIIYGLRRARFL